MKKVLCIVLIVMVASAVAACGAHVEVDIPGDDSITVTDMIGREVEIVPGGYERVVCIGAGALRMYSYVGNVGLLCGVEDIDNMLLENRPKMFDDDPRPYVMAYEEFFEALPSCGTGGPNAQTAEAEKILSCDPDIVISEYEDVDKANALSEQLGVPVITLRTGPNGVFGEEFVGSIELLGKVFAREDRADELLSFVEAQTQEISDRTADIAEEDKPSVYICGLGNWGTTNHLTTMEEYRPFEVAHIKNVINDIGLRGPQAIEEEKFVALGDDIDVIIIDAAAIKNIMPLLLEDESMFDSCKAWREGRVYLQMAYNAYYTNYEIALANAWYNAKAVYPDAFDDIDMMAKLDEITYAFLGMDLADQIIACPGSYSGYQRLVFITEECEDCE